MRTRPYLRALLFIPLGTLSVWGMLNIAGAKPQSATAPANVERHIEQGNHFLERNELWEALEHFNKAIELDPDADEAFLGRGIARGRARQLDSAIEDLDYYIARHPDSSFAYTKRGVTWLWRNQIDKARQDLLRAVRLDAGNAEAHDDLGVVYAQNEEVEKAIESFTAAITLDPGYKKAYHNLAMIRYALGQQEEALKLIDEALRLRIDRDGMLLKAAILRQMGRDREAQALEDEAAFQPETNWQERMPIQ